MNRLNTLVLGMAFAGAAFASDVMAANIGTVICEGGGTQTELTVSVGNISWGEWWNYETLQAHGFTSENRIISFDPQRLHPSKSTYFFSYDGPEEIVRIKTYVTTNNVDFEESCL